MSVNKSLHVDHKCFCSTLSSFYITHTHAFDWRSRNPCAAQLGHGWIRSLACWSRNSVQWLTWRSLPEEWRNCGTVENASIMISFCIAANVRLQIYLSGWSNAFWLLHLFALWLQCLFTPQNYSCSKNRPSSSSNVVIHQPKRSHNIKPNLSNSAQYIWKLWKIGCCCWAFLGKDDHQRRLWNITKCLLGLQGTIFYQ